MNDHDLGQALRSHVLAGHQQGRPLDPARLKAILMDLADAEQQVLLPALRALVQSTAFRSAISQVQPLSDPRLLPRLNQELEGNFSLDVRQRMAVVLAGLLNQPAPSASTSNGIDVGPDPARATPAAAAPPQGQATGCGIGMVVLGGGLALLGGTALIILGAGLFLWLRQHGLTPQGGASSPIERPAVPEADPIATPPPSNAVPPGNGTINPEASGEREATEQAFAIRSIGNLYNALSAKDHAAAREYYGDGSADQFDPAFFNQFERVSVSDLTVKDRDGSTLDLAGVVTFVYPDGTSQVESRTFTVDTSRSPALVTASAFGRVIRFRR